MEPRQNVQEFTNGMCVCVAAHVFLMNTSHFVHLKFMEVGATFLSRSSHNVQEVWCEHKGNPLLTDSHETLIIPQDVAKVDVEEVSCTNTKDIRLFVYEQSVQSVENLPEPAIFNPYALLQEICVFW